MKKEVVLVLAVVMLATASCRTGASAGGADITASPDPSMDDLAASASPTDTARPTETVIPAETPLPPTPVPTITPTPSGPLNAEGPWGLMYLVDTPDFPRIRQLYAINPDGTGFQRLDSSHIMITEPHPQGQSTLAYIARAGFDANPELRLLRLPDLNPITLTALSTEGILPNVDAEMLYGAIVSGGLAWSPDGTKIAFVGARDDPSVDVYVIDVATRETIRVADLENYEQVYVSEYDGDLPDETLHAAYLTWSADSRYVFFDEFTYLSMGIGADSSWSSRWAARSDGSGTLLLMKPDYNSGRPVSFGWLDSVTWILSQARIGHVQIVAINLDTRHITTIIDEELLYVAYAPEHNTWLLWPGYYDYDGGMEVQGTLQLLRPDSSRIPLPSVHPSNRYFRWSAADDAFLVEEGAVLHKITVDGRIAETVPAATATPFTFAAYPGNRDPVRLVSPDGTLWAWETEPYGYAYGLWVGAPYSEPDEISFIADAEDYWADENILVDYARWSPDSQRLILLTNKGLYIAERPDFDLIQITEGGLLANSYGITMEWLP